MQISDIFLTNKNSLQPPENNIIVYIICSIFILGNVFEAIFAKSIAFIFYLDCANILLSIIITFLFVIQLINKQIVIKIQVLGSLSNIIISHFFNPFDMPDYTGIFLRNIIIIFFLMIIYAIYCGKYHVFQIGIVFVGIYISVLVRTDNAFLENSAPLLITCGILFQIGIFYILDNLENMQKKQISLNFELQQQTELLMLKNKNLEHQKKQINEQAVELKQLVATKDRFFSILAHDLRSPFNSILGFTELLRENLHSFDFKTIEYQLGVIHSISNKTYNLLEDLLMWAKSQTGQLVTEPKRINFNDACCETIENLKSNAIAKNITISYPNEQPIFLWADDNMLKTIIRNLVSNAIKFTHTNGLITIYAEEVQNMAIITVSDNGIGIHENDYYKLWEIGTKYSTKGTANESGSGLGLILCKEFVEKHGGTISVESTVGKGTKFQFNIPLFLEANM